MSGDIPNRYKFHFTPQERRILKKRIDKVRQKINKTVAKRGRDPCEKTRPAVIMILNPAFGKSPEYKKRGRAQKQIAHYRAVFGAEYGWIPKGKFCISHQCHSKCVTVSHLRAVQNNENKSRNSCRIFLRKIKKKNFHLLCSKHSPPCFLN